MARRVFFSFHYDDIWRVSQVRNSWRFRATGNDTQPFVDKARWESIRRTGDESVKRWINTQLSGTSVTVVLIGKDTASRPYVKYEIEKSHELKKGIIGITIHNILDNLRMRGTPGPNPFANFTLNGRSFAEVVPVYDWVSGDGRSNLGTWVEDAAQTVGRP